MVGLTRALAPALVALLCVLLSAPPAVADDRGVTVATTDVQVGETVAVTGTGWPRGKEVSLSICEDSGGGPVLDCAPDSLTGVPVDVNGEFKAVLEVGLPPDGCPCVVVADGPSVLPVSTPLNVGGRGEAGPSTVGVVIEEARLVGGTSFGSWFGAAPTPDLELRVRNDGTEPSDLSVRVRWRDGLEDPVDVPVSMLSPLAAGDTRTVVVPLRFRGFSQGGHTVEGTLSTSEMVVPFRAETSVFPWGLYLLAVLALVGAGAWRNRWLFQASERPRRTRPDPEAEAIALELIEGHTHRPEPETLDPADVIARSTLNVPRQREADHGSKPGRRADRSGLNERVQAGRRRR